MHTLTLYNTAGQPQEHRFPGAWHELEPHQLPKVAVLVAVLGDELDTRVHLLQALTGLPAGTFAAPHGVPLDDLCVTTEAKGDKPLQVHFMPQLDWCFTPPDLFNPERADQPARSLLPTVQLHGITWRGPGDGLDEFTFNQWVYTDMLFQAFTADPGERNLHNFLGAAYQPAHATWSNEPIEEYGRKLAALPYATKLAAVLNYRGLRAAVARLYPSVFAQQQGPAREEGTSLGLFGMVYDVAAGNVFGTVPQVEATHMHKVLGYVEHTNQRNAQQEAAMAAAAATTTP